MNKRIFNILVWFDRRPFIQIVRKTLVMLFPIALLGSFARLILRSFLRPNGFFYNILRVDNWANQDFLKTGQFMFQSVTHTIFGLLGVVTVYLAAANTAHFYHRDSQLTGVTGVITLLLLSYRYVKSPAGGQEFNFFLFSGRSLFLSLILGYFVGQIYRYLTIEVGKSDEEDWLTWRKRSFAAARPLLVACCLGIMLALVINSSNFYQLFSRTYSSLIKFTLAPHRLVLTFLSLAAINAMDWVGLGVPYIYNTSLTDTAFAANLNHALVHGSAWGVPYRFLGSTLCNSFANFGGDGVVLALIVAILLLADNTQIHRVARWSALPTLFNFDYSMMVGVPLIMNPVFLLPFVFLPVANVMVAAGAIAIHLIPPTPYQVLLGAPGPLISFLGSNGDWLVLLFTILLLLFDVAAYVPFVKLNYRVEQQVIALKRRDQDA